MYMKRLLYLLIFIFTISFTFAETNITLCDISDEPVKKIKRFQPLADYLAEHLKQFGIKNGQVKIAPDFKTLITWFNQEQADLYFDSVYPALYIEQKTKVRPILRRWKEGLAEYSTLIITLKENNIKTLEDLNGKLIAFENEYSTSGFLLPLMYLQNKNFILTKKKFNQNEKTQYNIINYTFAGEDKNIYYWILHKKVDAGVIDSGNFQEYKQEDRQRFFKIAETEKIPRQLVMIRTTLDQNLQDYIKSILLNMHKTESGKNILEKFKNTTKFDEIDRKTEKTLTMMRKEIINSTFAAF